MTLILINKKLMTDTLYYDGKCPLCSHEIRLLARYKNASLKLIDVHSQDNIQATHTNQALLSVLHLQTSDGLWIKGLDATVKAWGHTKFKYLVLPLRWPIIKEVSDWFYFKWAKKRACRINY